MRTSGAFVVSRVCAHPSVVIASTLWPMPNALAILVYLLAVARVVRLITQDKLTQRPRDALVDGIWWRWWWKGGKAYRESWPKADERELINAARNDLRAVRADENAQGPLLAYLVSCSWCVSVYLGAVAAPVVWFWGSSPWLAVPALALALSYGVGFLASKEG